MVETCLQVNSSVIIEDGSIGYSRNIIRDITERKYTERVLQKSDALLNEIQVITKVGGWELDHAKGQVTRTDEYITFGLHRVQAWRGGNKETTLAS